MDSIEGERCEDDSELQTALKMAKGGPY